MPVNAQVNERVTLSVAADVDKLFDLNVTRHVYYVIVSLNAIREQMRQNGAVMVMTSVRASRQLIHTLLWHKKNNKWW